MAGKTTSTLRVDVQEAKKLKAQGWSWKRLAHRYGVSIYCVHTAVNPTRTRICACGAKFAPTLERTRLCWSCYTLGDCGSMGSAGISQYSRFSY